MGRTISAYFVYCDRHRAEAKAALQAQTGNEKVSVAQVAKTLGERWRQLPDDEKKQYHQLAAEKTKQSKERDEQEDKENANPDLQADEAVKSGEPAEEFQYPFGFPLSLVKRIMTMDEDLHSVSADALKMTAKTAEMIVQMLALKAVKVAAQSKRKTIKFADIQTVIAKDKRWELTGMGELMASDGLFEEARSVQNTNRPQKANQIDPKAQLISNFFKA